MDGSQFDTLLRRLTGISSRRGVVIGVLSGALGLLRVAESEAKRKHKKKKKKKGGSPPASPPGSPPPVSPPPPSPCTADANCAGNTPFCRNGACVACVPCPSGQCCTRTGTCGSCTVFVSSSTHLGSALGGLTGADALCQGLATSAGLPGTFMAWLSTPTQSPSTRFVRATVPYALTDGTVIANNWADLTDSAIDHPIDHTESAQVLSAAIAVWTNTNANGGPMGLVNDPNGHCGSWQTSGTGNTGFTSDTNTNWTNLASHPCSDPLRLYCFQQP